MLPVTLNLAYFTPLNGAGRIFPVNFNYQRCLENSNMINFWLTSWVPSWGQIFLVFSLFHFFTRHFEFSLLCTPKWCGSNFSSKLQQTDKYSNFVVTDKKKIPHFLPRTRVCNKQPLINTRQKYYLDNPVIFLKTRGKNWLISAPL